MLGKHAIKMIGYGVENGTNYYIGVNQWGADWGE
jgi:cathepsin B